MMCNFMRSLGKQRLNHFVFKVIFFGLSVRFHWACSACSTAIESIRRVPGCYSVSRYHMMTSSNGDIFRVTGHLCREFTGPGEFPTQRPVTRSFDGFIDLRPNKRLSKHWWGWWFETPLWRHCNAVCYDSIWSINKLDQIELTKEINFKRSRDSIAVVHHFVRRCVSFQWSIGIMSSHHGENFSGWNCEKFQARQGISLRERLWYSFSYHLPSKALKMCPACIWVNHVYLPRGASVTFWKKR